MKLFVSMLTILVVTIGVGFAVVTPTTASDVCPGLNSGKIDTVGDPVSVVVTAPTGFLISGYCVKAGSSNQGNGPVFVTVSPPQAEVTITYPGGKDISHYSVSYVPVSENTPTPTVVPPTATPTATTVIPTATNTPEGPTATPTNTPVNTATSTATSVPTATNTPTVITEIVVVPFLVAPAPVVIQQAPVVVVPPAPARPVAPPQPVLAPPKSGDGGLVGQE